MILPPLSMNIGLLLISIGVVNLWRARRGTLNPPAASGQGVRERIGINRIN